MQARKSCRKELRTAPAPQAAYALSMFKCAPLFTRRQVFSEAKAGSANCIAPWQFALGVPPLGAPPKWAPHSWCCSIARTRYQPTWGRTSTLRKRSRARGNKNCGWPKSVSRTSTAKPLETTRANQQAGITKMKRKASTKTSLSKLSTRRAGSRPPRTSAVTQSRHPARQSGRQEVIRQAPRRVPSPLTGAPMAPIENSSQIEAGASLKAQVCRLLRDAAVFMKAAAYLVLAVCALVLTLRW